jgi:4-alpha-glucanotransferase
MTRDPIRELAQRVGILAEYVDNRKRVVKTSRATRDALLSAMGIDAPTEDSALGWLDELKHAEREWASGNGAFDVADACVDPEKLLGEHQAMGIVANLYAARREGDWGVGDFSTLMLLIEWADARGAEFVGVNPLHALFNRDGNVSPYSPVSRQHRNHIYIDVEEVPEWMPYRAANPDQAQAFLTEAAELRAARLVDYDRVIALKERALAELYSLGTASDSSATEQRHREFAEYAGTREPHLTRYATWMAIAKESGTPDWREWAAPMRNPDSSAVATFAAARSRRIDFQRWLQFETHRQLSTCAQRARILGMRIGLYQDLAVGTHPGGSDTWGAQELFVAGVSIGAPPDPYAADGQNWALAPIDPRALRLQHYDYWTRVLRTAFECSGALRIDHVMGLFRLFWIPEGSSGRNGAYIRYPAQDLLGILARESQRHNAIVIGEDLGTVPPEVPRALKQRMILSSKVLFFERDPRRYPKLSLATVGTHDMSPFAGWAENASKGAFKSASRTAFKSAFQSGVKAAHNMICASPSALVGIALDDLVGETEPINIPGLSQSEYPCWRRRSRTTVEAMQWDAAVDAALGCENRRQNGRARHSVRDSR